MFDTVFEFLFKYDIVRYQEGSVVLQPGDGAYLFGGLLLLAAAAVGYLLWTATVYTSARSRIISAGLRLLALVLLCVLLLEPVLMYPDVVPNENFLAVLIDNSDSMGIPDGEFGESRTDDVEALLVGQNRGIMPELERTFNVRYYTFSGEAARIDSVTGLIPNGRETDLHVALTRVVSDFQGLPLSGIVMLTDGGDNTASDARSIAEELRGRQIPLHIVGLGRESRGQEREILSVATNRELTEGMGAEIEVRVKSWINERRPVTVTMYNGDRLVMSRQMDLRGNGAVDTDTFYYWPEERGVSQYTVQIAQAPDEVNTANNTADILIDSTADSVRVLYVEGYLRPDFKYIKRALEDDPVLEFASATRTGTGKYYRQGIYSVDELTGGFPDNEEELYGYKAIILGDIEANYFSLNQMEMIERFVARRGGGFLMLGGRHSFAEGEYTNTPVADLLPVEIDPRRRAVLPADFQIPGLDPQEQGFKFVPTRAGLESPILKFTEDVQTNRLRWDDVPRLSTINLLGGVKSGATVLAEKPEDDFGRTEPLLVVQRYGKGRSAALATASTWRWQMLMDHEDTRHERFWRQLMRWLSTETPDRVNIDLPDNRFEPGTDLPIRISVYDTTYVPVDFAEVTGTITDPSGDIHELTFFPDLNGEGEYLSSYVLEDPGVYSMDVSAYVDTLLVGTQRQSVLSYASKKEFQDAVLKRDYLEVLARLNGGVYYEPGDADRIPANLQTQRSSTSVFRYVAVWDSPFLFILIVAVLSVEWLYRRNKGMP